MSQSNVRTLEKATDSARDAANEAVKSASEGAARVGEKLLETYHNVRDRLQERGAEAKEHAGQVAAKVKEKADEVGEEIGAGYMQAKDKLSEGKESAIELFNDLIDQLAASSARVGGYVRNNPGKSFAAAALLGVIVTRAMSKRTRK